MEHGCVFMVGAVQARSSVSIISIVAWTGGLPSIECMWKKTVIRILFLCVEWSDAERSETSLEARRAQDYEPGIPCNKAQFTGISRSLAFSSSAAVSG